MENQDIFKISESGKPKDPTGINVPHNVPIGPRIMEQRLNPNSVSNEPRNVNQINRGHDIDV